MWKAEIQFPLPVRRLLPSIGVYEQLRISYQGWKERNRIRGIERWMGVKAQKRFPCGSAGKKSTWNVGDLGLTPGLGRSPGGGNSYPLQYSGQENSMDCIVHGVTRIRTWLSDSLTQGSKRSRGNLPLCLQHSCFQFHLHRLESPGHPRTFRWHILFSINYLKVFVSFSHILSILESRTLVGGRSFLFIYLCIYLFIYFLLVGG